MTQDSKPYPYEVATPQQLRIGSYWWCIHHSLLVEPLQEPIGNRVEWIRRYKPVHERECRLRSMSPVLQPELLPEAHREAGKAYHEAGKAYRKAWKVYDEARKVYGEAWKVYGEAGKVYDEAWKVYREAGKVYGEAWKVYGEAGKVYDEAWKVYGEVWKVYREDLVVRHDLEYPDNTWKNGSIF